MDQDSVEQEVRVDDLWFAQDSPIVIRAENRLFQVSKGILVARSTVFRDMIAFPQPAGDGVEQMDGCPVVRLHDSAQDVEVFLRAIFDSSYFMPAPVPSELAVVLGILRLSHKYDVHYLYRRALDHLAVDGWYKTNYDKQAKDHLIDIDIDITSPFNPLSVISAVIEVGAQWLLPCAYYGAATYPAEELLPFLAGKMEQPALKSIAAHAHLVRGAITIGRAIIIDDACATRDLCDQARERALSKLLDVVAETWVDPFQMAYPTTGMCSKCLKLTKTKMHEAASAFWDELPGIFGLQPWEELRAMKRAVMEEDAMWT
ncbi:hypothetical protein B0H13DRAFT_1714278 [Mycena leptocephala]|nr:hypothetical protein B0H13DRAFT_1714278 [Mycena leptocephala]